MALARSRRRTRVVALAGAIGLVAACTTTTSGTALPAAGRSTAGPSAAVPSATASGSSGPGAPAPGAPLAESTLRVPAGLDAAPLDQPRAVRAPAGWTVSVWARLDGARLEAWTPDGRLLVSRPTSGDVVVLEPTASGAPRQSTLVSGLDQPHGLAFAGSTLYVAESDRVDAYDYHAGSVDERRTVLDGLPDAKSPELGGAYAHALKSVAVGADGALYVSVGSSGNISADDRDADPQRATILRVPPPGAAGTSSGATPTGSSGPTTASTTSSTASSTSAPVGTAGTAAAAATVFARGVRNGTGLAIDPTGAVWTAVNNRDNIGYPYDRPYTTSGGGSDLGKVLPAYVNDHPVEELAKLTTGRDLGWPYCNPEPDVDPGVPGSALTYTDLPLVRDIQTNPDGSKLDCSTLPRIEQGMGAHSAPLGLSFATRPGLPQPYGAGALVGIHGSWNRQPPRAPEVSFFPWRNGTLGAQQTLLGGFQDADGNRWGRPVMAVQGPDNAVYVTDDSAGAIYRMQPPA